MQLSEAVRRRRAVKSFDPQYRIEDAAAAALIETAQLSPSSFNIQHWRVVNVTDPQLRREVRAAAWDQAQFTDASLLFILCADTQAWKKEPHRYWQHAAPAVRQNLLGMIRGFYDAQPQLQRDEALRSVGLFAQTLMLAAQAAGYDSCPMIGFDPARVGSLIRLPSDHVIGMAIAVGRALQPARPRGEVLPLGQVLFENGF